MRVSFNAGGAGNRRGPRGRMGALARLAVALILLTTATRGFGQGVDTSVFMILEVDGSISEVTTHRTPNADIAAEALRVVRALPAWRPGEHNGHPVRTRLTLPFTICLR